MNPWNTLDIIPPSELVVVKDKHGNEANAYPTYYPFKTIQKPGKWTNDIVPCDPYWDGGWMVESQDIENPLQGDIVAWRAISSDHKPSLSQ